MNKTVCFIFAILLVSCTAQTKESLCSAEQIEALLKEFNIPSQNYEYIHGDCTGLFDSKRAKLEIDGIRYSLAATSRSSPNSGGEQLCFTTEKQEDPLFYAARNQICERVTKWGFEQEYADCKKGNYDIVEQNKRRINLKFGSSRNGPYFFQKDEECMNVTLPH